MEDPEALHQRPPSRLPSNVRDELDGPFLEEEMQASHAHAHGKRCTWIQVTAALLSLQLG